MKGFSEKRKVKPKKVDFENIEEIEELKIKALKFQNEGELQKATKIYEILVNKKVKDFRVYLNYGILSQFQKNYERSIVMFKKSIELNSKNQLANFKIAYILNNLGKHKEALDYSLSALNFNQKVWQSHLLLIQILKNLNRVKEAISVAKKAIQIIDKNHLILANLAKLYAYIGEHKESEKFYLKSIEINPNDPETLYEYGIQMLSIGDKRKGSMILKKVIEISPNYSIAYFTLSRLLNTNKDKFYIDKILDFDISIFHDNYNKYNILFAKSYIFHRVKNFHESENLLKRANDIKLVDKPANSSKIINLSKEIYNNEINKKNISERSNNEAQNIFIVGLPRSGSTLVESILGIKKGVFNLGENSIFYNSYIEASNDNFDHLSRIYREKINNITKNKITTNKTLINYIYTPIILNYIENSKIIFTFRNPLDNILSMYRAKFTGSGNEYSSCIISSAKVLLNHLKIMHQYKNYFDDNEIYFLNYDYLVTNPELEIKRLTKWLHWEWDINFLNPELNNQAFSTASIVEVRSGITNKSLAGWKNYQNLLKPAKDYLQNKKNEIPNFFKEQFLDLEAFY